RWHHDALDGVLPERVGWPSRARPQSGGAGGRGARGDAQRRPRESVTAASSGADPQAASTRGSRPAHQSGAVPRLPGGFRSVLVPSIDRAPISFGRVILGSITSSMNPRWAAMYGLANVLRNSSTLFLRSSAGFFAAAISFLYRISTAPSGPITAISAEGYA